VTASSGQLIEQLSFLRLVRRAFCAPHPNPENEAVRNLIEDLAQGLWDRLHAFEVVVKGRRRH
jgi:hypothetical protein